jgi:hypothetical protein
MVHERVRASVLEGAAYEGEAAAVIADYEHRNRWIGPVVRRLLSALLGWRYDGSQSARERLVRQLPVVAFRPS